MKEIIDQPTITKKDKPFYSYFSLICALINTGCFIYLFSLTAGPITASEGIRTPPKWTACLFWFFCLLGVILAVMSLQKKEKAGLIKWAGIIINSIYFIVVLGLAIFAWWVDSR